MKAMVRVVLYPTGKPTTIRNDVMEVKGGEGLKKKAIKRKRNVELVA